VSSQSRQSEPIALLSDSWRGHRLLFGWCLVTGSLAALLWVAVNPSINATAGSVTIGAYAAAAAGVTQLHLWLGVLTTLTLPFGLLGVALLAVQRAPLVATCGGMLAMAATSTAAFFTGQDNLTHQITKVGNSPSLVAVWQRFNTSPVLTGYLIVFILGTVLGPVLLGVALMRAGVFPRWAVIVLIVRGLLQMAAFPAHVPIGPVEIVATALLLAGLSPAAVLLLTSRTRPPG
jgi:hypothetical protein